MLHEIRDRFHGLYPESFHPPSGTPAIVKAGGFAEGGQSTGLLFSDPRRKRPSVVFKASHAPSQDARILAEYENLKRFHASRSKFLIRSTPEPIGLEWIQERPVLLLKAHPTAIRLKDCPVRRYLAPRKARGTLFRATEWLVRFAREMRSEWVTMDRASIQERFVAPIHCYLEEMQPKKRERSFLESLVERSEELQEISIPLVPSHGDFCPANILEHGGEWMVIDWEKPMVPELPLSDLFYFLASLDYARASREKRGNRGRNFSAAFLSESPYRAMVSDCVQHACTELAIPRAALDLMFVVAWVSSALHKVRYLRSLGHDPWSSVWDDHMPVVRFRSGSCENVRDSLERSARLVWKSWGAPDAG